MSFDLTLFHGPRLRSFDRAIARLEAAHPPTAKERAQLDAAAARLRELGLDPVLDERSATLGLSLSASQVEAGLAAIKALLPRFGLVCFDPQEAVFTYANGADSRGEKVRGGVHEGVQICLNELLASPAPPLDQARDAADALRQFALADSPDPAAAARLALPALGALYRDKGSPLADLARTTAYNLAFELSELGAPLGLPADALEALCEGAPAWLQQALRTAQG